MPRSKTDPVLNTAKDFWNYVEKSETCWFFPRNSKSKQIKYKGRLITTYRLAWELANRKELPSKFTLVLHSCTNANCVNPDHLYIGTQTDVTSRHNTPEDFWKRVDKKTGSVYKNLGRCWLWTGATFNHGGYGQAYIRRKAYPAQRLAWILTHGQLKDEKLFVCHKCDNPLCVRPSHLFLGTAKQNTDDMIAKGRFKAGGTYIRTSAQRAAISKRMKGKQTRLGAVLSAETKARIGNANRGRKRSKQ